MLKNKKGTTLIVLILIVIAVLILGIIAFIVINKDSVSDKREIITDAEIEKLEQRNYHVKYEKAGEEELIKATIVTEELNALIQKGLQQSNYYVKYTYKGGEPTEIWAKDNVELTKDNGYITWKNYNTSEELFISEKDKKYIIPKSDNNTVSFKEVLTGVSYYLDKPYYKIESMIEEKYNDKESVAYTFIYLTSFYARHYNYYLTIWIDKETGFILKQEEYYINEQETEITEYDVQIGIVTDEDIKRPDKTGYTLVEER